MNGGALPARTVDLLAELAALGSFAIGERTTRDWPAIESTLGVRLPSEYKAYAEHFPVGQFRRLSVYHPESSNWPTRWGLVEAVKELSSMMRPRVSPARYQAYPEPGGLIPWADYEGDYYLCWLPSNEDPDRWPVVAYATYADEGGNSEVVDGSTLQALIRVIRGDAGKSVFPDEFYAVPATFSRARPEDDPRHPDNPWYRG